MKLHEARAVAGQVLDAVQAEAATKAQGQGGQAAQLSQMRTQQSFSIMRETFPLTGLVPNEVDYPIAAKLIVWVLSAIDDKETAPSAPTGSTPAVDIWRRGHVRNIGGQSYRAHVDIDLTALSHAFRTAWPNKLRSDFVAFLRGGGFVCLLASTTNEPCILGFDPTATLGEFE